MPVAPTVSLWSGTRIAKPPPPTKARMVPILFQASLDWRPCFWQSQSLLPTQAQGPQTAENHRKTDNAVKPLILIFYGLFKGTKLRRGTSLANCRGCQTGLTHSNQIAHYTRHILHANAEQRGFKGPNPNQY